MKVCDHEDLYPAHAGGARPAIPRRSTGRIVKDGFPGAPSSFTCPWFFVNGSWLAGSRRARRRRPSASALAAHLDVDRGRARRRARCSSFLIGLEANSLSAGPRPPGLPVADVVTAADRDEAELEDLALASRRGRPLAASRGPRCAGAGLPAGADRSSASSRTEAAMSVAIVDYGSGNLHSAAKAFERAARERASTRPIARHLRSGGGAPRRIGSCFRASAPSRIAGAASMRVPGMVEALTEAVRGEGTAVPRHLRRHAAHGDPGPRIRDEPGPRLDPRRGDGDRPDDPRSRSRIWAGTPFIRSATIRCSTDRDWRTGSTPISCTPMRSQPRDHDDVVAVCRLWRSGHGHRGARQYRRHPVPPRKEPGARPASSSRIS